LEEPELDHACEEWIQIIQNRVNLELTELSALALDDFFEVLDEAFPRAEVRESLSCAFASLQEDQVKAVASQMVSESLNALLWPSLDALQELALVLVMELLDAALELDLCGSQWMYLLELLKVEEGLRHRELVAASRRGQEALELRSVRQLQDQLVDLSEGLGIYVLELFPLQYGFHEELPDLVDEALLELNLRKDLGDCLLEALLESSNESSAPGEDHLFAFFEDKRRNDVIVVQCWHLNLDPLDSVTAKEADLRVPVLLPLRLAELERDEPLHLRLDFWLRRIHHDALDVEASESEQDVSLPV
jgi:hypothetical protein